MNEVKKTVKEIKSLKIQGARNVAREALLALKAHVKKHKMKNFTKAINLLYSSRPTEPMLRNLLDSLKRFTNEEDVLEAIEQNLEELHLNFEIIAEYGATLIPEGATVVTHCHSSTVTNILKQAQDIKVYCFETRPLYQGRKTAEELATAGVDVTLAVDSAMSSLVKKADLVLVGADSINSRGDLINKIGTATLAFVAFQYKVPFYSAAELLKFNAHSLFGEHEAIEQRSAKEVWEKPPKKLKIFNPAFELTHHHYISGYVTERGIISPSHFALFAMTKLGGYYE